MIAFGAVVLYDLDEVASLLGFSRSRVEGLVRSDEMAGVVHGGRWMVAAQELARFQVEWEPPDRVSRLGRTRRFRPPPRPGDLVERG